MQATAQATQNHFHRAPRSRVLAKPHGMSYSASTSQGAATGLSIRVLETVAERSVIADLRKYAPIEAERDLDAGVVALEEFKDGIGLVMAISKRQEVIATIRLIPYGLGVTLAEKTWCDVTRMKAGFGVNSWEVGRLIVAPEHRSEELLRQCLSLALRELVSRASNAEHLHASCSPLMARLYRRIGFHTEKIIQGDNGLQHALVHADVRDVAQALGISLPALAEPVLPALRVA
ncbi:N-acyl amino acid synthase FeeM domain-containing protein [Hydrogenophaga laconesensis]|uniref:GNAT family N-acyltransferase n=1 Tax=Hydrogenophaga laconesensis TaxID=1805971 RepID=A0ABU1V8D3_9BURK|nr:hypothetical protein [Hydrogenophaga laconesensis]MDR7093697.1 putative GNAT family N-acyltransferase [Hydrogenophaga laconesensis]